ncbi:MAG: hypothetical protein EBS27_01140 [Actinobacteria bacterium]|nr:hypothetical protein [Actinomycetota bacterium]
MSDRPDAYLCVNAVGHTYLRKTKPASAYKAFPLYQKHLAFPPDPQARIRAALESALAWAAPMADAPKSSRPAWFDEARAALSHKGPIL